MLVSDYLAVASMLLAMAVSWKALIAGRNGNRPAKAHDVARLIERIDYIERQLEHMNELHALLDKLATKIEYDIKVRLDYLEKEIFRQEMIEDLKKRGIPPIERP